MKMSRRPVFGIRIEHGATLYEAEPRRSANVIVDSFNDAFYSPKITYRWMVEWLWLGKMWRQSMMMMMMMITIMINFSTVKS